MVNINNLIDFINCHIENDTDTGNSSNKNKKYEEGIAIISAFSSREWLALRSLNFQQRSALWVECLINLLNKAGTEQARQIIIHIALSGTNDNFFKAMECIYDFRRYVDTYTWLKLKNRSAEMFKKGN